MSLMIGAVLGLCGFVAVLGLGAMHGVPFIESLRRALAVMGVGWLLGWLLFGPMGLVLARESAGPLGKRGAPQRPDKDMEEGKKEEEKGLPEGEESSAEPAPSEESESDR